MSKPHRHYEDSPDDAVTCLCSRSIEGKVCTSVRSVLDRFVLTFEDAPADEPLRLFALIPAAAWCAVDGWTYVCHDKSYLCLTRPLPPGTTTETHDFDVEDFAEEEAYLAGEAMKGRRLIAVRESVYYFYPTEPARIRYTVTAARMKDTVDPLLFDSAVPDENGNYYICANTTVAGRYYFADVPPMPSPLCEDPLPTAFHREIVREGIRHSTKISGIASAVWFALMAAVVWGIFLFDAVVGLAGIPVWIAWVTWSYVRLARRHTRKLAALDALGSEISPMGETSGIGAASPVEDTFGMGDVSSVARSPSTPPSSHIEPKDRMSALRAERRMQVIVTALFAVLTVVLSAGIITDCMDDRFLALLKLFIVLPLAAMTVFGIIRVVTISRKIRELAHAEKTDPTEEEAPTE